MNKQIENTQDQIEFGKLKHSWRTRRGIETKKLKGAWFGNPPAGYIKYKNDDGINGLHLTPESIVLREAFMDIASDKRTVVNFWLEWREKYDLITLSSFKKILSNRVCVGEIKIKAHDQQSYCWVEGKHRPIIDLETFEKVQVILREGV